MQEKVKILVTGCAGFIGHALCLRLREDRNHIAITGVDADHYLFGDLIRTFRCDSPCREEELVFSDGLKIRESRITKISRMKGFDNCTLDLSCKKKTGKLLQRLQPSIVVHLAALPGVLPSMDKPADYVRHNNCVSANVLEACTACGSVRHLLFASSSSVYGNNENKREESPLPSPNNIYAATKHMDETVAKLYGGHHKLPVTAMRFFTVYGPLGRADMAVHKAIATAVGWKGRTFCLNGNGSSKRSFTYIDDAVEAICRLMKVPPDETEGYFRAVNIGLERAHSVQELISCVERATSSEQYDNRGLKIEQLPSNAAEAVHTKADCTLLRQLTGYSPHTSLQDGIKKTVQWHKSWQTEQMVRKNTG